MEIGIPGLTCRGAAGCFASLPRSSRLANTCDVANVKLMTGLSRPSLVKAMRRGYRRMSRAAGMSSTIVSSVKGTRGPLSVDKRAQPSVK